MMKRFHESVLLSEVLYFLKVKPGEKYIDATLGGGGHSEAILIKGGLILGIDCDPAALDFSRKRLVSACPPSAFYWKLILGNFAHLKEIAHKNNFSQVAGVLFDLGTSWYQLKEAHRGFSFTENHFLDMRMDPQAVLTAYDLVNGLNQKELTRIFWQYGEESYANRIAKGIIQQRISRPIKTAFELSNLISRVLPKRKKEKINPATRCFQALRIAVNQELDNLESALPQAVDLLGENGRLVVISFHSLEDRIVKNFLKQSALKKKIVILTSKPINASDMEIKDNPKSRSAKLRAAEKCV